MHFHVRVDIVKAALGIVELFHADRLWSERTFLAEFQMQRVVGIVFSRCATEIVHNALTGAVGACDETTDVLSGLETSKGLRQTTVLQRSDDRRTKRRQR